MSVHWFIIYENKMLPRTESEPINEYFMVWSANLYALWSLLNTLARLIVVKYLSNALIGICSIFNHCTGHHNSCRVWSLYSSFFCWLTKSTYRHSKSSDSYIHLHMPYINTPFNMKSKTSTAGVVTLWKIHCLGFKATFNKSRLKPDISP